MKNKIPKNIIYCWLPKGSPKPQKVLDCIETWKKNMPEGEWNFIEVNETTFDVNNKYFKDAYENKAWAYASDYLRLLALKEYGGIYMDTDVEVYKSLDEFRKHNCFTGFEQTHYPVTAVLGAEKGSEIIQEMLDIYDTKKFELKANWSEYETNTMIMSDIIGKYIDRDKEGYQESEKITVYPRKYFCYSEDIDNEVYAKHNMFGSWIGD